MIYIKKSHPSKEILDKINEIKRSLEWKSVQEGDTKALRELFDRLPKETIRKSLLQEQHYLCAYCMKRIENDGNRTTIEHWSPLSKDKENAINYYNMLAVCDGGRKSVEDGKKVLCCDAYKGDDDSLVISPLDKQQMEGIAYSKEGFVKTTSKNNALEKDITEKLRLNGIWKNGKFVTDTSTNLVKGRKDAYQSYVRLIERLDKQKKCTSVNIKKKIDEIEKADHRMEYAGVYLYFLKKKYKELSNRGL